MSSPVNKDDFAVVLPLRTGGAEPPLFCVHPGFALCWSYAALIRRLGRNQPVYGIQARGILGDEELPGSFDELVTDYLHQIRAIQPTGPYRLLGWSFGGLVAHAMATRLQAAGEQVGTLALMDTVLADVAVLTSPDQERLVEQEFEAVRDTVPDPDQLMRVVHNLNKLRPQFQPEVFDGDMLLFVAAEETMHSEPVADAWHPYVSGTTEEHRIPCTHLEMMTLGPAKEIGSRLAKALRGTEDD